MTLAGQQPSEGRPECAHTATPPAGHGEVGGPVRSGLQPRAADPTRQGDGASRGRGQAADSRTHSGDSAMSVSRPRAGVFAREEM